MKGYKVNNIYYEEFGIWTFDRDTLKVKFYPYYEKIIVNLDKGINTMDKLMSQFLLKIDKIKNL